ncbi:hypothetical protein V6N13_070580 [Hibiscus sabdariffa]
MESTDYPTIDKCTRELSCFIRTCHPCAIIILFPSSIHTQRVPSSYSSSFSALLCSEKLQALINGGSSDYLSSSPVERRARHRDSHHSELGFLGDVEALFPALPSHHSTRR